VVGTELVVGTGGWGSDGHGDTLVLGVPDLTGLGIVGSGIPGLTVLGVGVGYPGAGVSGLAVVGAGVEQGGIGNE
jgi:hypothetical protein